MSAKAPLLIAADRVRALRLDRGLSARAIEIRLGVGGGWLHSLETGVNHAHISLRELHLLADMLGTHPADLLTVRLPEADTSANHPRALASDAARLGRILSDLERQTTTTRLASALGWTEERLTMALGVLATQLPAVGQRLVHGVAGVQVVRDSPEPDPTVAGLMSARMADNGLTPAQATMLARVMRGEVDKQAASSATMTNPHRVALAELVNAGLVDPPDAGRGARYRPSQRTHRSLLVGKGSG